MTAIERTEPLNERSQYLLKVLVERYIRDGQPVGSRVLARDSGLDLSPATVRNVMADLEEMGFVRSPHTSAGRIPTVQGYRLFVDTLLKVKALDLEEIRRMRRHLAPDQSRGSLMETASSLLSDITHLAGMVRLPRRENATLRQLEFLPLSDQQVLVIIVINEREVQNRVIRTARRYTPAELQQAANYLNTMCSGKTLATVREEILGELRATGETVNRMMQAIMEMTEKGLVAESDEDEIVVAGQTNLMEYGELADMDRLRHLFEAFNRKRDILHLLDQSLTAEGTQVFIGEESGYAVLDGCSVITSCCAADGQVFGVLGVIGPTRMAYDRVIPLVNFTARLLGAALNQRH